MNEADWQTSTDPLALYRLLHESTSLIRTRWQGWMPARRFRFTVRKDMLFRCAVVEPLLRIVGAESARTLLAVVRREQFLPETATLATDTGAYLREFHRDSMATHPEGEALAWEALSCLTGDARHQRGDWLLTAAEARAEVDFPRGNLWQRGALIEGERQRQAHLLREFVGNPFLPPTLPAGWEQWHEGLIPAMARRIDLNEDLEALPVLADALEDAGCGDAFLLAHLRHPGPHRRGCWVVDLLLGRE